MCVWWGSKICLQVRKQHLELDMGKKKKELDMEQQTGSK